MVRRMEDQLARKLDAYGRGERIAFLGDRVERLSFAQYAVDWSAKIERVGNLHYPPEAVGKLYGAVTAVAEIEKDGSLRKVSIERSSGHQVLDDAVIRIIGLAAPFPPFPEEIARDTDLIVITRSLRFTTKDSAGAPERDRRMPVQGAPGKQVSSAEGLEPGSIM